MLLGFSIFLPQRELSLTIIDCIEIIQLQITVIIWSIFVFDYTSIFLRESDFSYLNVSWLLLIPFIIKMIFSYVFILNLTIEKKSLFNQIWAYCADYNTMIIRYNINNFVSTYLWRRISWQYFINNALQRFHAYWALWIISDIFVPFFFHAILTYISAFNQSLIIGSTFKFYIS